MGRPLLPIWKEFVTTVPTDVDKRKPDVACLHCRTLVRNARPTNLLRHSLRCSAMPDAVRIRLGEDAPVEPTVSRQELQVAMFGHQQQQKMKNQKNQLLSANPSVDENEIETTTENQNQVLSENLSEDEIETETSMITPTPMVTTTTETTERRPVLGKRSRAAFPPITSSSSDGNSDSLERVLTSIRDVLARNVECKMQELQLRREELEFQREALATKMEERRQAREEDRRDRREQREADRQEKLELARIENEKNLAFLKAVMESSAQQRR